LRIADLLGEVFIPDITMLKYGDFLRNVKVNERLVSAQKVDPFDRKSFAVIKVSAHDLFLVRPRGVVKYLTNLFLLDLAHYRFNLSPKIFGDKCSR
jgi:hypothetical protein